MARWCRGYWSSQGRVEKGWNWVAECNIQRPSQTPSLVVFIRHIISEVLQYRRHPFRARRHPWSEPDAILGGSPLNRDFANIGEPECMLDNIGGQRPGCGRNYKRHNLREPSYSILCGEIKLLIDGFRGQGLPAIDFSHVDLSGSKQCPE